MTSSGLKRPLDYEFAQHRSEKNDSESLSNDGDSKEDNFAKATASGESSKQENGHQEISPRSDVSVTTTNGTKRRCTTTNYHQLDVESRFAPMTSTTTSTVASLSPKSPRSPTKDSHMLNDDIDALIRDELHRSVTNEEGKNQAHADGWTNEPPILTARQTQAICEKLVRDRERKLKDEYDRKLARKLAEQYDLFAKAKYLDAIVERSARNPSTTPAPPTTAAATNNPSITNAIAAAIMQRSAVAQAVSVTASSTISPPSTATCTAQNLPNLSSLATSLSANNHSSAIQSPHMTAFSLRHVGSSALRQTQAQQHPHQIHLSQSGHHQLSITQQTAHQHQHRATVCPNNGPLPLGPVLLSSNLDEQLATPEALFTLFGVFGDVIRVKILFNKKDNALIQMADANQAQVAQSYLDKQKIYGKVIRVTRSKHLLVQMPREGNQTDAGLTKDFTNSPLHRFKIPGSRNYLNIYPPSTTLHISNIPAAVQEEDLHRAFKQQCHFEFISFKFFPKDRKMALMRFNSIEHATIALIKMHNYQISDEHNLRVSFSKSSI